MARTTIAPARETTTVKEQPDTTHERMSAHDAEMAVMEEIRYENGIDESGTLGRW